MELEAEHAYRKVWMVVEVGYKWIVSMVDVSAGETNYTQDRVSFWHLENV